MKSQKLLILGPLGLGMALLAYLVLRPAPAPLPPISVLSPSQLPPVRVPLFARIVPRTPTWTWAWRLRDKVRGPRKVVTFDVAALRLGPGSGTNSWGLPAPGIVTPEGLQIWRLDARALEALRRQLKQAPDTEVLCRPSLTTGDGCPASMSSGGSVPINGRPTNVGLFLDFRPALHGETTDVIASVLWREAVTNYSSALGQAAAAGIISLQTNVWVVARLQLSNADGVFLLRPPTGTGKGSQVGVLLSATRPRSGK